MQQTCTSCSVTLPSADALHLHILSNHAKKINFEFRGVNHTICAPLHRSGVVCPCPLHLFPSRYGDLAEISNHLVVVSEQDGFFEEFQLRFISRQLVNCPVLSLKGLALNVDLKFIVCIVCNVVVNPNHLKSHLAKQHDGAKLLPDEQTVVNSLCDSFGVHPKNDPPLPTDIITVVDGLEVLESFKCSVCGSFHANSEAVERHGRRDHASSNTPPTAIPCLTQRFKKMTNSPHFEVKRDSSIELIDLSIAELLEQAASLSAHPLIQRDANADARNVCPFLRQVSWRDLVADGDVADVRALVAQPNISDFPSLRHSVVEFFVYATNLIDMTSVLNLRKIRSPTLPLRAEPLKRHQREATVVQYALPVVGLLAMLLRGSPVSLPPDIQRLLDKLRGSLENDIVSECIRLVEEILPAIWHRNWPAATPASIFDPTVIYLAYSSLRDGGQFLPPSRITPICAQFKNTMRLTLLARTTREAAGFEDPTEREQAFNTALESHLKWVRDGEESSFTSVRSIQQLAQAIATSTSALPQTWWLDQKTFNELLYHGDPVHLSNLRTMLGHLEVVLADIFEEKLLVGLPIRVTYDYLHDDLSNTEPGYSFTTDARNECFSNPILLLTAILTNSNLRSEFVASKGAGAPLQYNVHRLQKWMDAYREFQTLLLLRCYLMGGSPARGTEMTSMLLRNTTEYPLRNLVAYGKHIAFLCTYLKTSSMLGNDKLIPHALDAFTSDLMIQELAITRPFAMWATKYLYPHQPAISIRHSTHIFVDGSQLFNTENISANLKHQMLLFHMAPIGVSGWRHVSTAFRRKRCSRIQELVVEEDNDPNSSLAVGARQSGHSRDTENRIYGITQNALQGAPEDVLPLYIQASIEWHALCHAVPSGAGLPYYLASTTHFVKSMGGDHLAFHLPDSDIDSMLTKLMKHVDQCMASMLSVLRSDIAQLGQQIAKLTQMVEETNRGRPSCPSLMLEASTFTSASASYDRPSASPKDEVAEATPDYILAASALQALRKILKQPDADWKSNEQRQAVIATLKADRDVVAILPTNAGKTMTMLIPPLLEAKDAKVTVLVIPLRILLADIRRKLNAIPLPYEVFEDEKLPPQGTYGLILLSADRVTWGSWLQALKIIKRRKRVVRYIADEAHLSLLSGYREALQSISDIRSGSASAVILLSATTTPSMLPPLMERFLIKEDALIIRGTSNRKELSYDIRPVRDVDDMIPIIESEISLRLKQSTARAIIFVPSRGYGDKIRSHLKYPFYQANEGPAKRDQMFESWRRGLPPIIIATVGFGIGNDYPEVRLVIHAGVPFEMNSYAQECARAGRDGGAGYCLMLAESNPIPKTKEDKQDFAGFAEVRKLPLSPRLCIRFAITQYSDGVGMLCGADAFNVYCQRCLTLAKTRYETHETHEDEQENQFTDISREAQKRRTDRQQTESAKSVLWLTMLSQFKQRCGFCLVITGESPGFHAVDQCPTMRTNKDGLPTSRGSYFDWKKYARYPVSANLGVCWFCHVPTNISDNVHGKNSGQSGPNTCPTRDILGPIVYGLIINPKYATSLRTEFPTIDLSSKEAARTWLTSAQVVPGHVSNWAAVFLWFAQKLVESSPHQT